MTDNLPKLALCGGLTRYLDNAALSEFTITCNGQSWKVHRLVLSLHSQVFAKACDGQFAEAKDMKYDLSTYSQHEVEALINYLYTFDYGFPAKEIHDDLALHTSMCCIADKYDIAYLRKLSVAKFKYSIQKAKASTDLVEASEQAYDLHGATMEIRESIVQFISKHPDFLHEVPANKALLGAMQTHPSLAIEVARAATKAKAPETPTKSPAQKTYKCPSAVCRHTFQAIILNITGEFRCPKCMLSVSGQDWHAYFSL